MKRFVVLLLVFALVLSLAVPALAADEAFEAYIALYNAAIAEHQPLLEVTPGTITKKNDSSRPYWYVDPASSLFNIEFRRDDSGRCEVFANGTPTDDRHEDYYSACLSAAFGVGWDEAHEMFDGLMEHHLRFYGDSEAFFITYKSGKTALQLQFSADDIISRSLKASSPVDANAFSAMTDAELEGMIFACLDELQRRQPQISIDGGIAISIDSLFQDLHEVKFSGMVTNYSTDDLTLTLEGVSIDGCVMDGVFDPTGIDIGAGEKVLLKNAYGWRFSASSLEDFGLEKIESITLTLSTCKMGESYPFQLRRITVPVDFHISGMQTTDLDPVSIDEDFDPDAWIETWLEEDT